jgi:hypothetical protein
MSSCSHLNLLEHAYICVWDKASFDTLFPVVCVFLLLFGWVADRTWYMHALWWQVQHNLHVWLLQMNWMRENFLITNSYQSFIHTQTYTYIHSMDQWFTKTVRCRTCHKYTNIPNFYSIQYYRYECFTLEIHLQRKRRVFQDFL